MVQMPISSSLDYDFRASIAETIYSQRMDFCNQLYESPNPLLGIPCCSTVARLAFVSGSLQIIKEPRVDERTVLSYSITNLD